MVIGGIGSISGSVLATFLYVACSEWWLRVLDNNVTLQPQQKPIFAIAFAAGVILITAAILVSQRKKAQKTEARKISPLSIAASIAALALLAWDVWFLISPATKLPLLRNGFRMVVFSVVIMIVVLFFRKGIMGQREITDVIRKWKTRKEAAK